MENTTISESKSDFVVEKRRYLSFVDASNIVFCREPQIANILAVDGEFDAYLNRI